MKAVAPNLIDSNEFERTFGGEGGVELIDGVVTERPGATKRHRMIQDRVAALLMQIPGVYSATELSFRIGSPWQQWRADVGAYDRSRWDALPNEEVPAVAPDLVAEVLSGSEAISSSNLRRALCLQNGSREYWIIDPDLQTVEAASDDRSRTVYHTAETIPLTAFRGYTVSVDQIFST